MSEYYFQNDYVSTAEFHEHREAVEHWNEGHQRPRMEKALEYVEEATKLLAADDTFATLSDLGCGTGAMLAQVIARFGTYSWGYDFQPANVAAAHAKALNVEQCDVFNSVNVPELGTIVVMTEVLEHLKYPGAWLRVLYQQMEPQYVIASSPWGETPESHDACHNWGWDFEGYEDLFTRAGWNVIAHEKIDWSQVILVGR